MLDSFTVILSRCLFKYDLCLGVESYHSMSESRRDGHKERKNMLWERWKSDKNTQQGG